MTRNIPAHNLPERTKRYALNLIRLYSSLPSTTPAQIMGKQLLRAGTSVGAQYREAQRAKSKADFISKLEGCLQELEEAGYWLELLTESETLCGTLTAPLLDETHQLTAIFVSMVTKVKARKDQKE